MTDNADKPGALESPQARAAPATSQLPDAPQAFGAVTANPWPQLRRFTAARIALGRAGVSVPTAPQLAFQLAHARARDAVHLALDSGALARSLEAVGVVAPGGCVDVTSAAVERLRYLQRPDLGRQLDAASRARVQALAGARGAVGAGVAVDAADAGDTADTRGAAAAAACDVAFVIADGLSALAVAQNAAPFLATLMPRLAAEQWSVAPLVIVQQGRVAIGDEIGELLGAKLVVVLIGERPGLSAPDSMGLYMTWAPRVGLTDASRNCISNVRPGGQPYAAAAATLHYLMAQARRMQLSGVALKDDTPAAALDGPASTPPFALN